MSLLTIRQVPDSVLRQRALAVERVDDDINALLSDMLETMYHEQGIGLAANQVGVLKRLIVIDVSEERDSPLFLVNPSIEEASADTTSHEEGCLSLPGELVEVYRPRAVVVSFLDRAGKPRRLEATGLLSVCVQHEIDHLDGITLADKVSMLKRRMMVRRLVKRRHEGGAASPEAALAN